MRGARRPERLPWQWETARLFVRDVSEEDVGSLHAIFSANARAGCGDPAFAPAPAAEMRALVHHSLDGYTADGVGFQMQCFEKKPEALCRVGESLVGAGGLAGAFHCTFGAPDAETIWVGGLAMLPALQRQGLAREVIHGLQFLAPLIGGGQTRLCTRVGLRDWPALRFWFGCGFDKVLQWDGARELGDEGPASLVLEWRRRGDVAVRAAGAVINWPDA